MINELRELRKEYKLQNEFNTTIDGNSTYNAGRSDTVSIINRNKNRGSVISSDLSRVHFKSKTQMKGHATRSPNLENSQEDNFSKFETS
jgi:hypothetical protein